MTPPPIDDFPTVEQLRVGAWLRSIVHAVMLTKYPALDHEQSWDGDSYSFQDSEGSRGTITFAPEGAVAAFFFKESRRAWKWNVHLLAGMPAPLRAVAEARTLQYLLDTNIEGETRAAFTSIMWGTDRMSAAESWPAVRDHGALLIETQLLELDAAMVALSEDYEADELLRVGRAIFDRKRAAGWANPVVISAPELQVMKSFSDGEVGLITALRDLSVLVVGVAD